MNNLKKFLIIVVFLQSWIFFSFLLTTNTPLENSNPIPTNPSLKTSSNKVIVRILDETQVNYEITDEQQDPSICALSNETFAVAWESYEQDGWSWGVYASVFNATTGKNITSEFRVNQHTDKSQLNPSICALSNETFAVAWQSYDQDYVNPNYGVYARVFDATTGQQITPEFQVNDFEALDQEKPSICALSSNTLAIVWECYGQSGLYARLFDATTGNSITSEFKIGGGTRPSICALSNETFAAVWENSFEVHGKIFNATTGKNITSQFELGEDWVLSPYICDISNDILAIAWDCLGQDGPSSFGVYAGVINATTGKSLTSEFRVNEYTEKDQDSPAICALGSDMFVVTWESRLQDGSGDGVYAKVFNATTGQHIISEFQVNDHTQYTQRSPTVCALSNDTFAIAWESYEQDGDLNGIYCTIFRIENYYPTNILPFGPSNGDDDDDKDGNDSIPFGNLYLTIFFISVLSLIVITRDKILRKGSEKRKKEF
ncbi:MAG: hypothetical protein EU529_16505 [Promethearchaeota archaeon]|nr:MAG: hypothetical protein EU529_16505 [Candidatus Lokiarchaeota archaeon]